MTKFLWVGLFVGLATSPLLADERTRSAAELQSLQKEIAALQKTLQQEKSAETALTAKLDSLSAKVAKLGRSIRDNQARISTTAEEITALDHRLKQLKLSNAAAIKQLGKLLRGGYMLGQQSGLRLLVNSRDPHVTARQMSMFRYVVEARQDQLAAILSQTEQLRLTFQQRSNQEQQLFKLNANLEANQTELVAARLQHRQELAALRQRIEQGDAQISLYRERENALQRLLKQLQRAPRQVKENVVNGQTAASAEKSVAPSSQVSESEDQDQSSQQGTTAVRLGGFPDNKGKLPRPLRAKIVKRFGQKREGGLQWEGLLFASEENQEVSAIYPGQVVFADWFRGYGQLLVLDHGQGFMSLYGHNSALFAEVGEVVTPGQQLASATRSDDFTTSGLYFEIRHNGIPDDPLEWVK